MAHDPHCFLLFSVSVNQLSTLRILRLLLLALFLVQRSSSVVCSAPVLLLRDPGASTVSTDFAASACFLPSFSVSCCAAAF